MRRATSASSSTRRSSSATARSAGEEGCLLFPGVHEEVDRAAHVKVRAQDRRAATWFELEADGLLAVAIQHENDHLDGTLMIDRLSLLRRRLVHRAMVSEWLS